MIIAEGGIGAGFDFMDILNPVGGIMKAVTGAQQAQADAAAAAAKAAGGGDAGAMVFCPPGQMPNPQWAQIPAAQRGQAAAAGIQACVPGGPGAATGKLKCAFVVAGRRFPCTTSGFADALDEARNRARTGGTPTLILQIGKRSISLRACALPSGAVVPGSAVTPAMAQAAAAIPATMGPGGVFTCPPGYQVARNAAGQVVCAPPTGRAARATRGRARGRAGRHRGVHGLGDVTEHAYTSMVMKAMRREPDSPNFNAPNPLMSRLPPQVGNLGDYMDREYETARRQAVLNRFPMPPNLATVGMKRPPAIPGFMSTRTPPAATVDTPRPLMGALGYAFGGYIP